MLNIKQIVLEYLKQNNYDGLYEDSGYYEDYCCCEIDNLWVCGEPMNICKAGYKCRVCGKIGDSKNICSDCNLTKEYCERESKAIGIT